MTSSFLIYFHFCILFNYFVNLFFNSHKSHLTLILLTMENNFTHTGSIQYDLLVAMRHQTLQITLKIRTQMGVRIFASFFTDEFLLHPQLKMKLQTVDNIFALLTKKKNFQIDPVKGKVILLMGVEEQYNVEIPLSMVEKESSQRIYVEESNIYSEFGGEIENFDFPQFGGSVIKVEHLGEQKKEIKKQMDLFRVEMETWKKKLEEKKNQVKKMQIKTQNENSYQGQWKDSQMNGFGIEFQSNGDRYEGQWKDNLKNGKASFYFSSGSRYEGQYKNGLRSGRGIFYWNNGNIYEGQYKEDKKDGMGIYYWNNGNWMEGQFKNGKIDGKVIYHYADGRTEDRLYEDGEMVKKI